jgi:transposase
MRAKERSKARLLREQGCSVREIAKKISCAKSSVSGWVRGISLTDEQIR